MWTTITPPGTRTRASRRGASARPGFFDHISIGNSYAGYSIAVLSRAGSVDEAARTLNPTVFSTLSVRAQ